MTLRKRRWLIVNRSDGLPQWRTQREALGGGATAPFPNRHKNHSLKRSKSVEKLGGGGGYTLHAQS